jgi:signal transduction histidine kinase
MCIVGFADEVRQVIDNLLLNAVEAAPNNGRLAISVRPSRNWKDYGQEGVRLTVADNGCGIPKEHLARIFEPFFTTKPEKGTGLGLWVVRGIVAKHDGRISIRSREAERKGGTVVSILWPSSSQSSRTGRARSESAA